MSSDGNPSTLASVKKPNLEFPKFSKYENEII